MSILYKTFLFYNDLDNNLHYIGPYTQKGQPAPIYTAVGTYCGDVIARNMSERLDDISFYKQSGSIDVENIKKTIEEYSSQTKTRCFLCSMKDINCFKSETKGNYEGYIHNSLKRYMDLQHYDKEEHDASERYREFLMPFRQVAAYFIGLVANRGRAEIIVGLDILDRGLGSA